jgi:hypothetical protein
LRKRLELTFALGVAVGYRRESSEKSERRFPPFPEGVAEGIRPFQERGHRGKKREKFLLSYLGLLYQVNIA